MKNLNAKSSQKKKRKYKSKRKNRPWESVFYVDKHLHQLDWGDHPRTGDWVSSWTVFNIATNERVTKRHYSRSIDARRGAAQIFNSIEKMLLK